MYPRLLHTTLVLTLLIVGQTQPGRDTPAGSPANAAPDRSVRNVPLLNVGRPDAVPGEYIVVFGEGARNLRGQDPASIVQALGLEPRGLTVRHTYGRALNGFAARLDAQNLARLRADRRVKYIELVTTVRAFATQSGATWGLDRIDQRNLPLDGGYTYSTTASNVTAYIIDTGINTGHTDFGGRAVWGTNTTGDVVMGNCQGHGTHVAGTVGSGTWGSPGA